MGDTTTYYHYDESNKDIWRVIGENIIRPNGVVEEKLGFAYLPGDYKPFAVKQGSDSYYYQYNAHGDVVALTNENGTTVAQYEYDPWGNPTLIADGSGASVATDPNHIANINPYRYAGYRYDTESGLYYLQARYYDPGTYRFLTKDPDGGDKDDPLSQNLYAYAKGNPVSNVDPDGRIAQPIFVALAIVGVLYLGYCSYKVYYWWGRYNKVRQGLENNVRLGYYGYDSRSVRKAATRSAAFRRLKFWASKATFGAWKIGVRGRP